MVPVIPVQALTLPDISHRLQQMMAKNRANLEQAGIWEFLLWIREVNKIVKEDKVTGFVHTYQMKTKKAKVGQAIVDFSTPTIAKVFKLPSGGYNLANLPDLTRAEVEEIFECRIKGVKDSKWKLDGARHHWKGWFELINAYLLFRPDEHRMDQRAVVAAARTWEGVKINWSLIIQQHMNEEIQQRKSHHPMTLHLYSAFFISCLCQNVNLKLDVMRTGPSSSSLPTSQTPPTPPEIEVPRMTMSLKISELQKLLSEKQDKLEQIQEKNTEYLQQVNQLLQEKFSALRCSEQLQLQNVALKLQLEDLRHDNTRLQTTLKAKDVVKPIMIERSSNTDTLETTSNTPSISKTPSDPHKLSLPPGALPLENCARLWAVEKKIVPHFNLHQLYELHRDLFLIMVGLESEAWLNQEQFQAIWDFCEKFNVKNLFTEILARKHLRLMDPFSAFVLIGDVGARIYLYYADCEAQLQLRRTSFRHLKGRQVDWTDYGVQMSQQFYGQSRETISRWRISLESLLPQVQHEDTLAMVLSCNLKRLYVVT